MKRINIDIETFSSVDLNQTGVYKYAESPDFEVMLFGYSIDRGPKIVIDLTRGEKIPQEILDALEDPEIEKYAYNASFERVCLSHYLAQQGKDYGTGHYLDPNGWHCTRVQGATWGLPLSLAECGRVLDISDKKLDTGKELISYFCKPCAPTASNGGITRHMPVYDERDESIAEEEVLMLLNEAEAKGEKPKLTDMQKWTLFKYYNKRDVIAEEEIGIILDKREELLAAQKITLQPGEDPDFHKKNNEFEYKAYVLDQKINDRGVRIDIDLAEKAIDASKQFEKDAKSIIIDITGVANPGSNVQMLEWLNANGVYNPITIGTLVQALAEVRDRSPLEDNYYQKIVRAIQANVANKDRYLDFNNIGKLLSDESTHPEIKELFKLKSLAKDVMADLLSDKYLKLLPEDVQEVLQLKKQISKTSVKKYETMIKCACSDGRARGLFQFYGAPKTGRFAGRLIQLQNMSKNKDDDDKTAEVRALLKEKGYDGLLTLDKPVPEILSELVRTAIVPDKGYKFADADYSAIEARVLAWLANETWRLKAFADGQDIYCASASQMFGVPVEKHGQNANLRQKGKVAELACIAEGSLVLTDKGLIPIENITTDMKIWDGLKWVSHEGLIYRGEKRVITYENLTATEDHLVFVEGKEEPVPFGVAAKCGMHLTKTGIGGKAIRLGEDYQCRNSATEEISKKILCFNFLSGLRIHPMESFREFGTRFKCWMSKLLSAQNRYPVLAYETYNGCERSLCKSEKSSISGIWRAWNYIRFYKSDRGLSVFNTTLRDSRKIFRNRSDKQQFRILSGKSSLCNAPAKSTKLSKNSIERISLGILALCRKYSSAQISKRLFSRRNNQTSSISCSTKKKKLETNTNTVRVYDIRNAGPNHRYTVSGVLVHNCGYGGGVGALRAFGADKMGLTETEMQEIISSWRKASPNIKNYWYKIDSALKDVTDDVELEGSDKPTGSRPEGRLERVHTFKLTDERGDSALMMRLPSGRCLAYPNMREDPKYGLVYDGIRNGKWDFNKIYGALGVENITQATARDILVAAMLKLEDKGYHTIMHIHDEVVIEIPEDRSIEQLQEICNIMGTLPEWANKGGLLTPAEGYVADFFLKSDKCDAKSQLNIEAEATLEATEEQEFEQMFS